MPAEYKTIPLTKLKLDPDNSRHPKLSSQADIVEWMMLGTKSIGDKLYALAKDISEYGLNPLERVMVAEDEDDNGKYFVLEGNRRVTALKLLKNPGMAPTEAWKKKFSKLNEKMEPISSVPCVIFGDDVEMAFHFMELKHLGQSGGAGIVPWETEEQGRHQQRRNRKSRHHKALDFIDHVRSSHLYTKQVKEVANNVPITTLDRLLSNKGFREFLGFKLGSDGELVFALKPLDMKEAIIKVISDFGNPDASVRYTVNKVKNKDLIIEYQNEFPLDVQPIRENALEKPVAVGVGSKEGKGGNTKASGSNSSGKAKFSDPKEREKLIQPGTYIPIDPRRFNRIRRVYDELKSLKLQAKKGGDTYPNSILLLMRTFLEMSTNVFIEEKAITSPSPKGWIPDIGLDTRIKAVTGYFEGNELMKPQQIKSLKKSLGSTSKLAHPNSINDLVHNYSQVISPKDLIDIWDTYKDYLAYIWDELK
jgi:hypothetical protein